MTRETVDSERPVRSATSRAVARRGRAGRVTTTRILSCLRPVAWLARTLRPRMDGTFIRRDEDGSAIHPARPALARRASRLRLLRCAGHDGYRGSCVNSAAISGPG